MTHTANFPARAKIRAVLLSVLPDGCTVLDLVRRSAQTRSTVRNYVLSAENIYVLRWIEGKKRVRPVYGIMPVPDDCPKPEGKA